MAVATILISGTASAASWQTDGAGGTFSMGGTLTPPAPTTPWETMVGSVSGLDASLPAGSQSVTIPVATPVPVLGIRTTAKAFFQGGAGMTPQIKFGTSDELSPNWDHGQTTLRLKVKNNDIEIGNIEVPFSAAALAKYYCNGCSSSQAMALAAESGKAYYGGLPGPDNAVGGFVLSKALMLQLSPETVSNLADFDPEPSYDNYLYSTDFSDDSWYSSAYASGISAGAFMKLTLNNALTESTTWSAKLPVMVTYM